MRAEPDLLAYGSSHDIQVTRYSLCSLGNWRSTFWGIVVEMYLKNWKYSHSKECVVCDFGRVGGRHDMAYKSIGVNFMIRCGLELPDN